MQFEDYDTVSPFLKAHHIDDYHFDNEQFTDTISGYLFITDKSKGYGILSTEKQSSVAVLFKTLYRED